MKILVTGGSGFLGSNVADELSRRGHQVTIFDKKKSIWIKPNQKMCIGNILNSKNLKKIIRKSNIVYHFAALADIDQTLTDPIKSVDVNIRGTVQILDLCRKYNVKRFIYASTIYVNSIDGGFYRSSKKAAEDYIEEYKKIYDVNYTILRFGSLYGQRADDNNGVKKVIKNAIFTGQVSYDGSSRSVRKYINVLDAAKACADVLRNKYNNKHIIVTGKKKIKVSDFLQKLSRMLKISKKIRFHNKKSIGHYTVTPFTYKPKKGKKFVLKSNLNFYNELPQLIKQAKVD